MTGVEVIIEDLQTHPRCPHGPTLLFSRKINDTKRNFFACSACRDRKLCPFFLYEEEKSKYKEKVWEQERIKLVKDINHRKLFLTLNKMRQLPAGERGYCHSCLGFQEKKFWEKHKEHRFVTNISDHEIEHPSQFLSPLEDAKKEAQFLFSASSVKVIVDIFRTLKYRKVVSMGTPRIHEFVSSDTNSNLDSLLLDFDSRYHSFYSPLQFCWYNCFNHHFFLPESQSIFEDFLKSNSDLVLILDPPFGGRVEPLAHTLKQINAKYQQINQTRKKLPIFWVFPYFMEPQILNSLPDFAMLDYKVDYENHPLFQDGAKARKFGSPVRIFTNVDPSQIPLPDCNFCKKCKRWVSKENKHCTLCNKCTSKDGRTYVHCNECERCVKPSWLHCSKCERCCQPDHKCGDLIFTQACFHCKQPGHKKRDCPQVNHQELQRKRKLKFKNESVKRLKNKN